MTAQEDNKLIEQDQEIDVGLLQQASLKFLRWAHDQRLLSPDAYYPGSEYGQPELTNLSPEGIQMLRSRQIKSVGVNQHNGNIYVFLQKAKPGVRQIRSLPATCDNFQLQYFQGHTDPISPGNMAQTASPAAVYLSGGNSYYTCGSSISLGNARSAGTLGCIVRDAAGQLYGLSNNHVSGGCNYAPLGLPIVAPGVVDVSPDAPTPFTIGLHARQLPMHIGDPTAVDTTINQDAALFKLMDEGDISSMQQTYYDTPPTALPLTAGMSVKKVGRSSGCTTGTVVSMITGPLPVQYSATEYSFNGAVYFDNMYVVFGTDDRFSEAGDSGSLVVHEAADGSIHAVGIVVGGMVNNTAPGGLCSLIMPIEPILRLLNVELVSNLNV